MTPIDPRERFMKFVRRSRSGCWVWKGARSGDYGMFHLNGAMTPAHRASHRLFKGKVPEKHVVDHLCNNKACVNPEHLEAVTQRVNAMRAGGGRHNREKTHCPSGHPYSGANLYIDTKGARRCRACLRKQGR